MSLAIINQSCEIIMFTIHIPHFQTDRGANDANDANDGLSFHSWDSWISRLCEVHIWYRQQQWPPGPAGLPNKEKAKAGRISVKRR